MPEIRNREPVWDVWLNVLHCKVWEAVALTFDIEPREVKHSSTGWMADTHLFEEGQAFDDRLLLAERNLGAPGGLELLSLDARSPVDSDVKLITFAKWARQFWKLPGEMLVLAERDVDLTPEVRAQAEVELQPKERNQLLKLIHILADMAKLADLPPRKVGNMVEAYAEHALGLKISEKSVAEKIEEARSMFGRAGK